MNEKLKALRKEAKISQFKLSQLAQVSRFKLSLAECGYGDLTEEEAKGSKSS